MTSPQRLLVATDFSAGAARAADVAIDLAAAWGARIEWVHVGPEASGALTPGSDALLTSYVEHASQKARSELAALADRAAAQKVECAVHFEAGRPGPAVARVAEETGSDWVVVGAHGLSGVQSLLLGSVAEKIVRSSPVAVLCVRPGAAIGPHGIVVYGEDLVSSENRQAAVAVARSLGSSIFAVHVIEMAADATTNSGFLPQPELIESSVREARERLVVLRSEYGEDAEVDVCLGSASWVLCDQARRRNASLVVTGPASRSGLERWMLGSVAEKTLRHAPCSVLVLR